jgi:bifunctional UDP-N-acetylglucosamine pyrophosphorylase/glucosamine-1-phosphate N-acetyltransferase
MTDRPCLMIILAAGEGTRMKSFRPKVLHEFAGRSMLGHVIAATTAAGAARLAVVVGPGAEAVEQIVRKMAPEATVHVQAERKGTAHAVLAARDVIASGDADILVLFGDTPLVRPETLVKVRARLAAGADLVVLGFHAADPAGYGRLITDEGRLLAIREHRDANPAERAVTLCNAGIMAFSGAHALELFSAVGSTNAKGEFYLTDTVEIANARGLKAEYVVGPEEEFLGVNSRDQLAHCEAVYQQRRRAEAMVAGVTLVAPETVFFSHDTVIGPDVIVEPNVVFGPDVAIASGARIRAFSHLEGARVAEGAIVGPYARLRPGAEIGRDVHIGNFVEVKNGKIEDGAKVNHLTYIGDARVGAKTNIGAGVITCNYDGFGKYFTEIGANAFIGSDTALVAPVKVGDGAFIGSGSVITEDVPADALALGRGRQVVKPGWAANFRAAMRAKLQR